MKNISTFQKSLNTINVFNKSPANKQEHFDKIKQFSFFYVEILETIFVFHHQYREVEAASIVTFYWCSIIFTCVTLFLKGPKRFPVTQEHNIYHLHAQWYGLNLKQLEDCHRNLNQQKYEWKGFFRIFSDINLLNLSKQTVCSFITENPSFCEQRKKTVKETKSHAAECFRVKPWCWIRSLLQERRNQFWLACSGPWLSLD